VQKRNQFTKRYNKPVEYKQMQNDYLYHTVIKKTIIPFSVLSTSCLQYTKVQDCSYLNQQTMWTKPDMNSPHVSVGLITYLTQYSNNSQLQDNYWRDFTEVNNTAKRSYHTYRSLTFTRVGIG